MTQGLRGRSRSPRKAGDWGGCPGALWEPDEQWQWEAVAVGGQDGEWKEGWVRGLLIPEKYC